MALNKDAPPPAAATAPLTVATYNLHWLIDRAGVRRTMRELPQVNVWCLQELRVRGNDEHALIRTLQPLLPPGRWHVVAARVNRLHEVRSRDWEAQAIVSRFPLTEARGWHLDASAPKRRLALGARIEIGGREVCVVNTDHGPSFWELGDRNGAQFRALAARLAALDADCVILAGDFNCTGNLWRLYGNDEHVRRIDRTLSHMDLRAVSSRVPTFIAWPLSLRIDRIYTKNTRVIRHGVHTASSGSDHRPVWATLQPDAPAR